jgi:type VI protein secretion system component VasK
MHISPTVVAVIVIAVLVIVAVVVLLWERKRKTHLKEHFGAEYERAVRERGSEREARAALEAREKRVAKFNIRELSSTERDRYAMQWRTMQSRFVDDPKGAVIEADESVAALMTVRGYPMSDFEQRAADLSVDHPRVVQNYRAAHEIAVRHRQGRASTEELRQAMIYYRSLFEDLLDGRKPGEVKEVA